MKLEKKLSQLKNLKGLEPNINWEKSTKYEILGEIESQNKLMKAQKLSTVEKIDLFFSRIMKRIIPSTTKTLAGFLVFTIFITTGFQAQASVPGEVLWPVKRGIEKAELTLTVDPVKETKVYIKHVNKRLNEINKIIKEKKSVKNDKVIKKAVQHLKKDSSSVRTSLEVVKEEKTAKEIVELAKEVKESAKVVQDSVKLAKEEKNLVEETKDDIEIEQALLDIEEASNEVTTGAIEVAIQVHEEIVEAKKIKEEKELEEAIIETTEVVEEVSIEDADVIETIVTDMIIEEIIALEEDIQVIQDKVDIVEYKEMKDAENVIKEENNGILKKIDIEDVTVTSVKEKPGEAGIFLEEAKVFLEEGSLQEALDKVTESKEVNDKVDIVLDKVKEVKTIKEEKILDKKPLPIKEKQEKPLPIKKKPELPAIDKEIEEVILEEEQELVI